MEYHTYMTWGFSGWDQWAKRYKVELGPKTACRHHIGPVDALLREHPKPLPKTCIIYLRNQEGEQKSNGEGRPIPNDFEHPAHDTTARPALTLSSSPVAPHLVST